MGDSGMEDSGMGDSGMEDGGTADVDRGPGMGQGCGEQRYSSQG